MAGRGRGATLPAWMTVSEGSVQPTLTLPSHQSQSQQHGQYDDHRPVQSIVQNSQQIKEVRSEMSADRTYRENHGDRVNPRRSRSRDRNGGVSGRRNRSPSPRNNKIWKPRNRPSNFDVKPSDGVELPPIGVNATISGVPNSFMSYASNPPVGGSSGSSSTLHRDPYSSSASMVDQSAQLMVTRHARRIYAGGIPPRATEGELQAFFNDIITKALLPVKLDSPPVLKVYLNVEKCYAFVEFSSIELTSAVMQLDGVKFDHYTGPTVIRIRRPNDYRPETLPAHSLGPVPVLNLAVLGGMGAAVTNGPGKIFIGGLPYNLADEQIMELLSAFGPVKSFHQVRDPGSVTSKGYAFCEYFDLAVAEAAISGLNGLQLGEKTLSVRVATQGAAGGAPQQPVAQGTNYSLLPSSAGGGPQSQSAPQSQWSGGVSSLSLALPTRVLQLSNMVTAEDLRNQAEFEDIREDVRLECAEHGQVLRVLIPRAQDGFSPALEGLIFVEFYSAGMAKSAAMVLNGRKFADKTVVVNYFDEAKFANGIYS